MNELEKMLAGKLYDPSDETLLKLRQNAHKLCLEYNQTSELEENKRAAILKGFDIKLGKNVNLQGPIYFDYGKFTSIGDNTFANFNLTILDCAPVKIGNNVFIGTGVSILTPIHPMTYQRRNSFINDKGVFTDLEYAKGIVIEDNCWIASNVTICGGVTIGSGSVIGAGSLVKNDIPKNSFAAGNPARVIRQITSDDDKSLDA